MVDYCYWPLRIIYEGHIYLITSLSQYTVYHFQRIWATAICAIPLSIVNSNQNLNLQIWENKSTSTNSLTERVFCWKILIQYFIIVLLNGVPWRQILALSIYSASIGWSGTFSVKDTGFECWYFVSFCHFREMPEGLSRHDIYHG